MIRTFYSFFILVLFLSCQQAGSSTIDADKLKGLQKDGVIIVDVRTEKEYADGHIVGVKHNINFLSNDFLTKMEDFDKSKPIIIHCARGGRSGKAAATLKEAGFLEIYDYVGGFNDWKARGEKIEK